MPSEKQNIASGQQCVAIFFSQDYGEEDRNNFRIVMVADLGDLYESELEELRKEAESIFPAVTAARDRYFKLLPFEIATGNSNTYSRFFMNSAKIGVLIRQKSHFTRLVQKDLGTHVANLRTARFADENDIFTPFGNAILTFLNRCINVAAEIRSERSAGEAGRQAVCRTKYVEASVPDSPTSLPVPTKVFLGHGHSEQWKILHQYLESHLGLECTEFNSEPQAGNTVPSRLDEMLNTSQFAFLIMTGEDTHPDGSVHARHNVIHEIGLFQGRLGTKKAVVLLEEGCSRPSNTDGLIYIGFAKGRIEQAFTDIKATLAREGVIRQK